MTFAPALTRSTKWTPPDVQTSRLAFMLEPRIMFDAAAVETAATVATSTDAQSTDSSSADTTSNHTTGTDSADTTDTTASDASDDSSDNGTDSDSSVDDVSEASSGTTIVFVDSGVTDYDSLIEQFGSDVEVVVIDSSGDGLQQIADALSGRTDIDTIAIISHGSDGEITLAGEEITESTLTDNADLLATIGDSLSEDGDILLYGCDVASSDDGISFVETLSTLTDADVAASSDETGASDLGGDWDLEVSVGTIDSTLSTDLSGYEHLLSDDDGSNLEEVTSVDDIDDASSVLFSSDGAYAYVGESDGEIAVYSVGDDGSLTLVLTLDSDTTGVSSIDDLEISSDSTLYAVSGSSVVVLSWDSTSDSLTVTETISAGDTVTDLAVSDDGAYVYVTLQYNGMTVYTRDTTDGTLTQLTTLSESSPLYRPEAVYSVGDYVYVACDSGTFIYADYLLVYQRGDDGTLTLVATIESGTSSSSFSTTELSMTVSDDGSTIYVTSTDTGTISVFTFDADAGSLTLAGTTDLTNATSVALSDDGSQLVATSSDGSLTIYDIGDDGLLTLSQTIDSDTSSALSGADAVAISATGTVLVAGSTLVTYHTPTDTDTDTLSEVTVLDDLDDGSVVRLSSDGAYAYVGESDGEIAVYSVGDDGSLTLLLTLDSDTTGVSSIDDLEMSGDTLYAVSGSSVVVLSWDSSSSSLSVTETISAGDTVTDLAISDDGAYVYVTLQYNGMTVYTRDTTDGTLTQLTTLSESSPLYRPEAVYSVGDYVYVACDSGTFIYADYLLVYQRGDDGTLTLVATIESGTSSSSFSTTELSMTVSDDGSTIYVTSTDTGTISVFTFDADAGSLTLAGTTDLTNATSVALSDDGSQLLATSSDGSLSIYDIGDDGLLTLSYTIDSDTVSGAESVAISASGTVLVAGSSAVSSYKVPNDSPTITDDGDTTTGPLTEALVLDDLDDGSVVRLSDDGAYAYVGESDGEIAVYAVGDDGSLTLLLTLDSDTTGVSSIDDLEISGDTLYAVSGSSVVVLTWDSSSDSLSVSETVSAGDTVTDLTVSDDGAYVYVTLQYNGMTVYTRDTTDGTLTQLTTLSESSPLYRPEAVYSVGDYVYVACDSGTFIYADYLLVYQRGDDGTLTLVATIESGTSSSSFSTTELSMTVSDDGSTIYVTSTDTGTISVFTFDADAGSLTLAGTTDLANATSVTLSDDGSQLLATSSDGSLSIYDIGDDGLLTLSYTIDSSTSTGVSGALSVAISASGTVVVVGDSSLATYQPETVSTADYTENGGAIVLLPTASFSDTELDELDNYDGASITIQRDGEASSEDDFGFADSDSLTLSEDGSQILLDGTAIASFSESDGVLTITFTSDVSAETANAVLNQITYTNTSITEGDSVTLDVVISDGETSSSAHAVTVSVTESISLPTLSPSTATVSYTEDSDEVSLLSGISFGDDGMAELNDGEGNYSGLSVTISGLSDDDSLGFSEGNDLTLDGDSILLNGTVIATVSETDSGMTITFTDTNGETPTTEVVTSVLSQITYGNTSDTPDTSATLTVTVDTGTATASATVSVEITAVNDAPQASSDTMVLTDIEEGDTLETTLSADLFSDADDDSSDLTLSISDLPDGLSFDAATGLLSGTPADGAGDYTMTLTATDPSGATASITLSLTVTALPQDDTGTSTSDDVPVSLTIGQSGLPSSARDATNTVTQTAFDNAESQSATDLSTTGSDEAASDTLGDISSASDTSLLPGITDSASQTLTTLTEGSPTDTTTSPDSEVTTLTQPLVFDGSSDGAQIDLTATLGEGTSVVGVQMANGASVPAWLHVDAQTGTVTVTNPLAAHLQSISLRVTVRAADGSLHQVLLVLSPQSNSSGQQQGTLMPSGTSDEAQATVLPTRWVDTPSDSGPAPGLLARVIALFSSDDTSSRSA